MLLKYQIIFFCVVAYLISWGSKFLISSADTGLIFHQIPKGLLELTAQCGPTIAGIISIIIVSGRVGIKSLLKNLSRFNITIQHWYGLPGEDGIYLLASWKSF